MYMYTIDRNRDGRKKYRDSGIFIGYGITLTLLFVCSTILVL